jgi:hypothetical protein
MFDADADHTDDSSANNKLRKAELERRHDINCGRCRYNRGENAKRVPRRSWKARAGRRQWAG